MNREIKRRMKRDQKAREKRAPAGPPPPSQRRERVKMRQFLREVQGELRRVIWPTRNEVMTYSVVVIVVVVILTMLVFGLDLGFAKSVLQLFNPPEATAPAVPLPSPR